MKITKVIQPKIQNFIQNIKEYEKEKTPEEIKEQKKKLTLALAALGASAVAGISLKVVLELAPKKLTINKFNKNSTIENGLTYYKNRLFSGTVKVPEPNGNKTFLKYKYGNIQSKVTKTVGGDEIFRKTFTPNYIKTESNGNITEEIKTKTGVIIKENGILKQAIRKTNDGTKIVADFVDGKPIKSTTYIGDNKNPYRRKDYIYKSNGKLEKIIKEESHGKYTTTYSENGSFNVKYKSNNYWSGDQLQKEVVVKGDSPIPYDADIKIWEYGQFGSEARYYKNNQLIIKEKQIIDSVYGSSGNHAVGLQGSKQHKYIDVYDVKSKQTMHKRVYQDGSYDVLLNGHKFGAPSEIEHFDSTGKSTGFSKITYTDSKSESSKYDDYFYTYYKEQVFDSNHNLLTETDDYYVDSYCKFND